MDAPAQAPVTLTRLSEANDRLGYLLDRLEVTLVPVLTSFGPDGLSAEADVCHEFDAVVTVTESRAERLASILDRIRL